MHYTYRIQVFAPMELDHVTSKGGPKFLKWAHFDCSAMVHGEGTPMIRVAEHVIGFRKKLKLDQKDRQSLRDSMCAQFPNCEITVVEVDAAGNEVRRMSD